MFLFGSGVNETFGGGMTRIGTAAKRRDVGTRPGVLPVIVATSPCDTKSSLDRIGDPLDKISPRALRFRRILVAERAAQPDRSESDGYRDVDTQLMRSPERIAPPRRCDVVGRDRSLFAHTRLRT